MPPRTSKRSTRIREQASEADGIEAHMLGQVSSSEDFKVISEEDLQFGESIGIVAAIVVLLIVFGAIVAGYLPLLLTIFFTLADHARHRRAVRHPVGLQLLHAEPDLDDGHRGRGGLRPVHRVAVPRGAARGPRQERRDPRVRRHGVTRGVLQRLDRRAGARRHAPRADDDLPEPGGRRDHRRAGVGGGVDDPAAGAACRSWANGSTGRGCTRGRTLLVWLAMVVSAAVVGGGLGAVGAPPALGWPGRACSRSSVPGSW